MNTPLNLASPQVAVGLFALALIAFAALAALAARDPLFARIGWRNIRRRPLRAALIIFGLMLATTFVATSLVIDQTVTRAVQGVAVASLGRVDEEISGGNAQLGTFPQQQGATIANALAGKPHVAGVAAALAAPGALIVDETSRQARGDATALGYDPTHAGPLDALQYDDSGAHASITQLNNDELFLNSSLGQYLSARPGDTVTLYSTRWSGQRFRFTVRGVVSGGLLGANPTLVLPLDILQSMLGASQTANGVYIANEGDGVSGVVYSDEIANRARPLLAKGMQIHLVKQNAVRYAIQTESVFSRILALFTLFALSINLLLVFLIFALLASERREEIGVSRAIGMRRGHVVELLLFEGALYDVASATPGALAGLGLSALLIVAVRPTLGRLGIPLDVTFEPQALLVAFALGALCTLATTGVASWSISRMTILAALRGQSEEAPDARGLRSLVRAARLASGSLPLAPGRALADWAVVGWRLVTLGALPALLAVALGVVAIAQGDSLLFSLGACLFILGVGLLARWLALALLRRRARARLGAKAYPVIQRGGEDINHWVALGVGLAYILYWVAPLDLAQAAGLGRFDGGIDIFFVAGMVMIFGAVVAITLNARLLVKPFTFLARHTRVLRHVTSLAFAQPAEQRFRTGVSLAMLALVCFTMAVMACVSNSITQRYANIPAQSGGYNLVGRPLFGSVGGIAQVSQVIAQASPQTARRIAAISEASPLPIGVVQPDAPNAGWRLYPASQIQGAFLDGAGLPLVARAEGFADDAAVWSAVGKGQGDVVIDVGALNQADAAALGLKLPPQVGPEQFVAPPIASGLLGPSSVEALAGEAASQNALAGVPSDARALIDHPDRAQPYTLKLDSIVTGPRTIRPTTLWIADLRGGPPRQARVVGLVDNAQGQRYGLLGAPQTFAPIEQGLPAYSAEYYFFRLTPGADAQAVSRAIGSALLDDGFETTVLQDALLNANAPRVFASRVLVGLVGLTLLVGLAALAVTGLRNVVERRQQIGMLRALGFHRLDVLILFLLESLLVALLGIGLGFILGLALCYNVFAVDFFDQFQSGLALAVPWVELGVILLAALSFALLAAALPASQASEVAPAEALRYE